MFSFFANEPGDSADSDDIRSDDDDDDDSRSTGNDDSNGHASSAAVEEGRSRSDRSQQQERSVDVPSTRSALRSDGSSSPTTNRRPMKSRGKTRSEGEDSRDDGGIVSGGSTRTSSPGSRKKIGGTAGTGIPSTAAGSESGSEGRNADDENRDNDGTGNEEEMDPLTDSSRLKGYITLVVASTVHYDSAKDSDEVSASGFLTGVVPADETQRSYAMAVSMITLIISLSCVVVHFDRFTCLKSIWTKVFKRGSKIELSILLGLVIWWLIATGILTSLTGIAGPGKGHFNLYFSSWTCLWTSVWTLERWLVAANLSSMTKFMESWPNRAPGWIVCFILAIGAMLSVLDLFLNWSKTEPRLQLRYSSIGQHQWEWLIFVPALTIPVSAGFFMIELFRVTRSDGRSIKSDKENMFEGLCICTLALFWIPTLFIATTPGGAADQVGNAYFFIWGSSIVVTETCSWWIRDWRMAIHDVVRMQQEEYKRTQLLVLKQHREEAEQAHAEYSKEAVMNDVDEDKEGEKGVSTMVH